jgi:superfamily II DNA or RNA helicase
MRSSPSSLTGPAVDSPDAADAIGQALQDFDPASRNRGHRYFQSHCVTSLRKISPTVVHAVVHGSFPYSVELERSTPRWTGRCSCPVGTGCKHIFAALLAWRQQLTQPSTPAAADAPQAFREQLEPVLAAKLGRPLGVQEGAFLDGLAIAFRNFLQTGIVHTGDVQRLGYRTREMDQSRRYALYSDWWDKPPGTPLELWNYIAHDIQSSGQAVPEFLRPVTDTTGVVAARQRRQHAQLIARWHDRLRAANRPAATDPEADARLVPLQLRLCLGAAGWSVETRPDDAAPWKSAPASFLERTLRETNRSLAQFDASPATFAFLAICQTQLLARYRLVLKPEDREGRATLHRLLLHPLARTLVVTPAGQPVTIAAEPLVRALTPANGPGRDFVLALQFPDGSPVPAAALYLPGKPDLYLHDGRVHRGPAPLDGESSSAALIPAEVVDDPATLQLLRQLGTRLPGELTARCIDVALQPRIECELRTNGLGDELFALTLVAHAPELRVRHVRLADSWEPDDALGPAAAPPPGKFHAFDHRRAEAIAAQLPAARLAYDAHVACWTRRVTRAFPDEFVAWREGLPADVEVHATGELASLLGATVKARIDFTLLENETHRDWFDLALALKPEDSTLTPAEIALLLRARGKLVRLPGKGWRRLTVEIDGAPAAALEAAGFEPATLAAAALAGEQQRFHALQLANAGITQFLPERQAAVLRARATELARPAAPAVPATLRAELRPYQKEGFEFLAFLSANRLGGVLADDMGLGKTVQTLAWLLWLHELQPAADPLRVLIVCPKSVVGNWEAETAKFAPLLATVRFAGPETSPAPSAARPTLTLTNYTQLRIAAAHFTAQTWHAVVLDEGQFIKTPTSKVAQVARALRSERRLVLTGTPVENRLLDLWSLFAFALPGLLGPQAAFKRLYAQENPLALSRLRTRVRHFLLRRTKAQVAADLPPRTEEDVLVELEGDQRTLYEAELKRARAALLKVGTAREFDRARFHILASLLRLRQICCHPTLVDPTLRTAPSAKLDELADRLEELRAEGHQVLVFSQFVTMLELVRERLVAQEIPHLLLTGQTEDRDALVREFQADKDKTVFLLSLKAAGFGLNLTAASYVVLFDPWWNPAVEAQAIDRTHRIGQTVPVNAYRLIARGTVEEKIRALQREKAALAGAIVQEESLASVLDLDSLRQVLS